MDFTVLLFLILRLKVAALIKIIITNAYIVFFKIVITLLSFFNSNLFLGLNYGFIRFFSYYNIFITRNTFFFNNLI